MLFHLDLACRDLHGILSDPYTWCEVVSRLLERPYLELPFSKLEARGLVEVVTASRHKKKCDVPVSTQPTSLCTTHVLIYIR